RRAPHRSCVPRACRRLAARAERPVPQMETRPPRRPREGQLSSTPLPAEKQSPTPITRPAYLVLTLESGLVPDANVAIEGVALYRRLAEGLDRADEVVGGRAVRRASRGDHVLLDHHRAHVVGSKPERDLAHLHPLRDPARLDVVDGVEVDAADRLRQQVVEGGRAHLVGDPVGEPVPVALERPGDEGAKAVRLVLELADAAHVLNALLESLDVA